MAARYVIGRLANKGTVIQLEGEAGASPAIDRKQGFDEVMGTSNVKIASQGADFNRSAANDVMTKLIKAYPEFDAVFVANDDMILGVIEAMSDAGIEPSKNDDISSPRQRYSPAPSRSRVERAMIFEAFTRSSTGTYSSGACAICRTPGPWRMQASIFPFRTTNL